MGLIADSSVIIANERRGHNIRHMLEQFERDFGDTEIAISVVTIVELVHGIERANSAERRARRQAFVDELIRDVPVYPVTIDVARVAGRIEGSQAGKGLNLPFEDLLIAATALHLGFAVATENIRHFEIIPGVRIASKRA